MSAVFADSFYWIALTDPSDSRHQQVVALTAERKRFQILTVDEVLVEYLTFFSSGAEVMRYRVANSVRLVLANPSIKVIPQSRESFLSGLDLYSRRSDKGYSLTDCISMQTMRRAGITDILTNDHHFEQEGFRRCFVLSSFC